MKGGKGIFGRGIAASSEQAFAGNAAARAGVDDRVAPGYASWRLTP